MKRFVPKSAILIFLQISSSYAGETRMSDLQSASQNYMSAYFQYLQNPKDSSLQQSGSGLSSQEINDLQVENRRLNDKIQSLRSELNDLNRRSAGGQADMSRNRSLRQQIQSEMLELYRVIGHLEELTGFHLNSSESPRNQIFCDLDQDHLGRNDWDKTSQFEGMTHRLQSILKLTIDDLDRRIATNRQTIDDIERSLRDPRVSAQLSNLNEELTRAARQNEIATRAMNEKSDSVQTLRREQAQYRDFAAVQRASEERILSLTQAQSQLNSNIGTAAANLESLKANPPQANGGIDIVALSAELNRIRPELDKLNGALARLAGGIGTGLTPEEELAAPARRNALAIRAKEIETQLGSQKGVADQHAQKIRNAEIALQTARSALQTNQNQIVQEGRSLQEKLARKGQIDGLLQAADQELKNMQLEVERCKNNFRNANQQIETFRNVNRMDQIERDWNRMKAEIAPLIDQRNRLVSNQSELQRRLDRIVILRGDVQNNNQINIVDTSNNQARIESLNDQIRGLEARVQLNQQKLNSAQTNNQVTNPAGGSANDRQIYDNLKAWEDYILNLVKDQILN